MPDYSSFRDLKVWHASMVLVESVYALSARLPPDERFGLTSQLRRASVSIPSNIAEGKRRKREQAYLHHLDIALGSQGEVEVQLELAHRLGFIRETDYAQVQKDVETIGRMLYRLIESLQPGHRDEPTA
jgi:four helix bundle protein